MEHEQADLVVMSTSYTVTVAAERDLEEWQAFACAHAPDNGMLDGAWYRVLADAFSVERLFLMCRAADGRLVGLAPLYVSRSPFTGHHLTNLEDGWHAEDDGASQALLRAAMAFGNARGVRYLLLRNAASLAASADRIAPTVRRIIHTSRPAAAILGEVKKKNRWSIRQAAAKGFVVEEDPTLQRIDVFYELYARHMRDLGTPVMSAKYFHSLKKNFGAPRLRLFFVCRDGREIGGMLCLVSTNSWLNMYAIVRKEFTPQYPNYLLYWHAIECAANSGVAHFDLGRSLPASNTYFFKSKWPGTDREVLHCYFGTPTVPARLDRIREQNSLLQRTWKHVPLPLTNWLGPKLRDQLPFS
jgi:CelD/BcsL family acetyltransferase involved in cellulose biosynthesis